MAKEEKGVKRTKMERRKPKLQAVNGTNIEVDGEAVLEFEMGKRKCGMKFLDADVKKPLGAVSAKARPPAPQGGRLRGPKSFGPAP